MKVILTLALAFAVGSPAGVPEEKVASDDQGLVLTVKSANFDCGLCGYWELGSMIIWDCEPYNYVSCEPANLFGDSHCDEKSAACAYTRLDFDGSGRVLAEASYCDVLGEDAMPIEFVGGEYRYTAPKTAPTPATRE